MKYSIIVLKILIATIGVGVVFCSTGRCAVETKINKETQKIKIQRFGVDGVSVTPKSLQRIPEIGDGWSGVNDLRWKMVEPEKPRNGKHLYDWAKVDNFLKIFQKTGRKLQVIIRVYNDWALEYSTRMKVDDPGSGKKVGSLSRIKPEHLSDWAAFISEFVERYDGDGYRDMPGLKYPITVIQIESEAENVWESVDGYVEALCTAYRAAKKASPNVQVMAGGFAMFGFFAMTPEMQQKLLRIPFVQHKKSFIEEFFPKAGTCFDILALHLNTGYDNIMATVKWFQKQMKRNDYQKPIWSEDTSSGPVLDEPSYGPEGKEKLESLRRGNAETVRWFKEEQAKLLVKKAVIAFASGVDKVFISGDIDWFNYYLPIWRYMGLLDVDGNPKPAYYSFKTMVTKIDGFTKVERVALPGDVFAYCFTKPSGIVYVLWSEREKIIGLPVQSKNITVTDISGNQFQASPLKLRVNASPIFVEVK